MLACSLREAPQLDASRGRDELSEEGTGAGTPVPAAVGQRRTDWREACPSRLGALFVELVNILDPPESNRRL